MSGIVQREGPGQDQEGPSFVIYTGYDLPLWLVRGHRGDKGLLCFCSSREQASAFCLRYWQVGYRHLRIYPITLGEPDIWRGWTSQKLGGADDGR